MPTEILEALYRGDDEAAERLARDNELDAYEAAALGREDRLRELIDADPMLIRAYTDDGFTALHLAAFFQERLACVRLLLDRGADPNAHSANDMEVTPLGSAAARDHGEAARLLVEAGAHPDEAQRDGVTPLHSAAANGNEDLVELFLRNDASPSRQTGDGKTAADLAAQHGHAALAERLRESTDDEEGEGEE